MTSKLLRLTVCAAGLSLALGAGAMAQDDPAVEITHDVVYGHSDGTALTYDVIAPENANGAAILYMVSARWRSRWRPAEARVAGFEPFLDEGYTMIAVHHRSAPRFLVTEAAEDVERAVRHVRAHADDYGVDADRLGVTGASAGGHLSLMVAMDGDGGNPEAEDPIEQVSSHVKVAAVYYPPTDLRRYEGSDRGEFQFEAELLPTVSPLLFVDASDPPTLIIHGDADEVVPVSDGHAINEALDEAGVENELIVVPGAGHGFRGEDADMATAARVAWFNERL